MNSMTFKALFEHSTIGIIISNTDGSIYKCNRYAAQIFGYEPEEVERLSIEDLVPPSHRQKHVEYRKKYNHNPVNRAMGGLMYVSGIRKDGAEFPVDVSLTFFEEEAGTRRVVSFISDISARKEAERSMEIMTAELESKVEERTKELSDALAELNHSHKVIEQEVERRKEMELNIRASLEREKELNQLKSRFVSMASHEFRTPLAGILSSASLLGRYQLTEQQEKREKHIATIKKTVHHLTSILNEFLSLDKLDQGIVRSTPTRFKLAELVEDAIEGVQDLLDKGQTTSTEHQDKDVVLVQDAEILRNAMINLLSNASKYSPEGALIRIETEKAGDKVKIAIHDSGIGIPKADQKHLFERFFRAQNAVNIKGTGLGLNIVKNYLDIMGGEIEFASEENKGTTFTITLPLEKQDENDLID